MFIFIETQNNYHHEKSNLICCMYIFRAHLVWD
jgi:hypothetical protein